MRLSMRWTPEHQIMRADDRIYEHKGRPYTTASHDCSHLIVAAHGNMPWYPTGYWGPVNEFNAIQVQRLYIETYTQVGRRAPSVARIVERWNWHAHFYAVTHTEKYKINYPISLAESKARFFAVANVELLCRLWPIYVDVYEAEGQAETTPVNVSFRHDSAPPTDEIGENGKALIRLAMEALKQEQAAVDARHLAPAN